MKAFILAAGRGERMRPLTDTTPKPLLKVGSRSLIEHNLMRLAKAGVTEVVINLSYRGKQIKKALGDGHAFGVSITYSDESPAMLGPGGGIVKALPILGGDHFIVMGSDLWSDFPIATLLDKTHRLAHMVMVNNPDFHSHGDYGITNGFLSKDTPTRTYAGYSVWHPSLFHDAIVGDAIELVPFIEKALALNEITAEKHEGTWHNIGTPGQLQALQRVAL